MCVRWTGKWRKTTRSIVAYKVCHRYGERYVSEYTSSQRMPQDPASRESGRSLQYKIGKQVRSKPPGIYLYRKPVESGAGQALLKVRIPAGTKIRTGTKTSYDGMTKTINATRILVLEEGKK
jgi:hypothetical protein